MDRQVRALTEAGCIRVFADKQSGESADRPELAACLDYLRPGDVLVVPSLDRLSRSLQDLINLVAELRRRGVGFRALHGWRKLKCGAQRSALLSEAVQDARRDEHGVLAVGASCRSRARVASSNSRRNAVCWKPRSAAANSFPASFRRTLLTNIPDEAKKFLAETDGPVVYKPLSSLAVPGGSGPRLVYTSVVGLEDFEAGQVSATAHMFQEFISKEFDVRVTVVGGTCFATEIHTDSRTGKIDWRADYDSLRYRPATIPPAVEKRIIDYIIRMGLNFAAFDFAVTPDGVWFFLEANPNGQWAWISDETGDPIAEAIASLLAHPEGQ